jgi:predicted transposase YbfD/YdcC
MDLLINDMDWYWEHFAGIVDPRDELKIDYLLDEILLVGLCTIICGGESWEDMKIFGRSKLRFLKTILPFANGIPSCYTYERVFMALDPKQFENCMTSWIQSKNIGKSVKSEVIAIDGKTARGSYDKAKGQSAIHLVSAWCVKSGLLLGQKKVDDKSNEITAIPELINHLDIKGQTVTIDAMGCQKEIAKLIKKKKGDYIFSLKGNHSNTHSEVVDFFARHEVLKYQDRGYEFEQYEDIDKAHGRIEVRKITIIKQIGWLVDKDGWEGLSSVAMIDSERIIKGASTKEKRYYISSLQTTAKDMLGKIRDHWGIENSLHWVLDVVFNEDKSRVREQNASRNLATIRKIALNLVKLGKNKKNSIKGTRKLAGWSNNTLKRILMI